MGEIFQRRIAIVNPGCCLAFSLVQVRCRIVLFSQTTVVKTTTTTTTHDQNTLVIMHDVDTLLS